MPRRGSTTERGYGTAHQRAAKRLKDDMEDGDRCCRCGGPLYRWQLELGPNDPNGIDADHYLLARVEGGELPDALAHRGPCNRSAGATLGNQRRGRGAPAPGPRLRQW